MFRKQKYRARRQGPGMTGPVLSRKCPPAIYRRAAYMRPLLRGKTLRFHIRFFQQHFCGQKHHRQPARTRQQKR